LNPMTCPKCRKDHEGPGQTCADCRAKKSVMQKARYARRRDAGLCPVCGRAPETRKVYCDACGKKAVEANRRMKERRGMVTNARE
jgi:predicted amidophosphoribosyltransferase